MSKWSASEFAFNLRFPGQYFDQETGTHYNMARDYDSRIGRYIQSDPIGLYGGINTYAYVDSSPIDSVDPYGLAKNGRNDAVYNACRQYRSVARNPCTCGGNDDYEHNPWQCKKR